MGVVYVYILVSVSVITFLYFRKMNHHKQKLVCACRHSRFFCYAKDIFSFHIFLLFVNCVLCRYEISS